jgi:hypothetical protein
MEDIPFIANSHGNDAPLDRNLFIDLAKASRRSNVGAQASDARLGRPAFLSGVTPPRRVS